MDGKSYRLTISNEYIDEIFYMLQIFHHHHPHNKKPSLSPEMKQSLYQALLILNFGFMDNLNIIHMQSLSLSFIECQ